MTATTIRVQMAQRKDTAANWTAANPILLSGEIGYETDTKKFKIGNGSTAWNSLAYLPIPDGSGNLTITGNLEIGSTGSLTFEGSTADGFETTLAVTNPTADRTITLPNVTGTVVTTGDTGSVTSTMIANGTIVDADISSTAEIAVSKLANGTANQVIVTDGTNVSWSDNLTLAGDLTVNGTTTTINTQDLLVEDKNIIIGNVATPSDVTADGGGITLKGATDKTINWVDATDAWTLSEHVNVASGKEYRIAGTKVLDATSLGSSVLITSANITDGTIVDGDISATAEIAVSKLADGTARQLLQTDSAGTGVEWASNIDIPGTLDVTGAATFDSSVAVTGTLTKSGNNVVTVGDTGTVTSTMILDGTIVDGDVNATAAIAGTKISPNFGSQNVTTTGTSTAASLIPTSSTAPTNGLYLNAANSVALATNGTGKLFVDSTGNVGINATPVAGYGNSIQLKQTGASATGAILFQSLDTNNQALEILNNALPPVGGYTAGYNYTRTGAAATLYRSAAGNHNWFTANTGTEGGAVTFVERLRITSTGQLSHIGAGSSGSPAVAFNGSAPSNSLVIDSTGRVGLGSSSPSQLLTIRSSTDSHFRLENNVGDGYNIYRKGADGILQFDGTQSTGFNGYNFSTTPNGGSLTSRLFISTGGNVGVGTTNPGSRLEVLDTNTIVKSKSSSGYASFYAEAATGGNPFYFFGVNGTETARLTSGSSNFLSFSTGSTAAEAARIDSSGRLLVGTSSTSSPSALVIQNNSSNNGVGVVRINYSTASPGVNDTLGVVSFGDNTHGEYTSVAGLRDGGTWSASSKPTKLVFSTTADGASSPTERLRITNDGVLGYNQPAPVAVNATATLTVANLKTGIITSTTAAAVTMTLPTGTLTEGGFSGLYNNFTFEWTVINTGATNAVTVQGGTDHTLVGSGTVAAGVSGRFASRRTAANTFVTYRLS